MCVTDLPICVLAAQADIRCTCTRESTFSSIIDDCRAVMFHAANRAEGGLPARTKSRNIPSSNLTIPQGFEMTDPGNHSSRPPADTSTPAFVMDGNGIVVEWGAQAEATFGWSRDQAVGRRLSELVIPERHRASHEAGLKRFLTAGRGALLDRPLELAMLHRDGREFSLAIRIGSEKTPDGFRFPTYID
jgi:PAS domain S-box-containing protein